jgi:hypothetical protein
MSKENKKPIKKDVLLRFVEDYLLLNTKLNSDEVLKTFYEFKEVIKKEEYAKLEIKLNKKLN